MASAGAGYDVSTTTFSPDGRIFQEEYACKAVDNALTAIALGCADGVLFAVEKPALNCMVLPRTHSRIFGVEGHIGIAATGVLPDCRMLVSKSRAEAENYYRAYGEVIPVSILAERTALVAHSATLFWSTRPYGAALLLAGKSSSGGGEVCELHCVEPNGTTYRYFGHALGRGKQTAKAELEKLDRTKTCVELLNAVALIIRKVHEENKERPLDIELAWIRECDQYRFSFVPEPIKAAALEAAERSLADIDMQ